MILSMDNFNPCLLLAAPELRDPNFYHSVILLTQYNEEIAAGVIVNHPLDITLDGVEAKHGVIASRYTAENLWYGGPVQTDRIVCLYDARTALLPGDEELAPGIGQANSDILLETEEGKPQPDFPASFRIIAGYAGWLADQINMELRAGSWLVTELQPDLIFDVDADAIWSVCLGRLGVDPTKYHMVDSTNVN